MDEIRAVIRDALRRSRKGGEKMRELRALVMLGDRNGLYFDGQVRKEDAEFILEHARVVSKETHAFVVLVLPVPQVVLNKFIRRLSK